MLSLGQTTFDADGQTRFAQLSGDFNPMHMDPIAARRTQAGAPVVHGIHTLLRGLDHLARLHPDLAPIARLKVSFNKLIYLGETVTFALTQMSEAGAIIETIADGAAVSRTTLTFGPEAAPPEPWQIIGTPEILTMVPADLTIEQMAGRSGWLRAPATEAQLVAMFPDAARAWSAARLRACLATTALVGMVCPGLNSIFGGMTLQTHELAPAEGGLAFQVTKADARVRVVRIAVRGDGVSGTIDSFARMPPTRQAGIADVAHLVDRHGFAGSTALVLGGSRGIGELTANILAAGGARVIITYAAGAAEAEEVAAKINAWGGQADTMHYDVLAPAAPQLAALPDIPSHLYYCATPQIFRRKAGVFNAARFAELQAFYVTGFHELFVALHAMSPSGLAAFYPSSTAVESRPEDMTEYAMAKAAGEILAADIAAYLPKARIVIHRLPRLPTDQTATVARAEAADPVAVMLPIIRAVQAA